MWKVQVKSFKLTHEKATKFCEKETGIFKIFDK